MVREKMVLLEVEELLGHEEVIVKNREVHHALIRVQNLACSVANHRVNIEENGP